MLLKKLLESVAQSHRTPNENIATLRKAHATMENIYLSNRWRIETFTVVSRKIKLKKKRLQSADPTEVAMLLCHRLLIQLRQRFLCSFMEVVP